MEHYERPPDAASRPEPRQEHGSKLRRLRRAAALSQTELAAELGTTKQAISRWETGLNEPNQRNKRALAELYGLPIEELSRSYDWIPDEGHAHGYRRSDLDPRKLREARQTLGLTQTQAAERAGLSVGAISQYEAGIVTPKTDTILRLAAAYERPVEALMAPRGAHCPEERTKG